jgi:hypothetical protein
VKTIVKETSKELTMLEKGDLLNKGFLEGRLVKGKRLLAENKSLLDAYKEIQEKQRKEEDWFEEKLRKLRKQTYQVIKETEEDTAKSYADKYLTKNQAKSKIIGAKEYVRDEAPDTLKVYTHYARKYGIPFTHDNHKKTLEQIVRDIHSYEMKNRDEIIKRRQLDPCRSPVGPPWCQQPRLVNARGDLVVVGGECAD